MLAIFQTICSHIVTKKNRVITKSLMFPCTQIDDCRWQIGDSVYSVLFINKTHDTQNCGRWAESFPKQFFLFLHFLPSLRGSSFHCDATQVIELRALCFQIGVILSAKCSFTPSAIDSRVWRTITRKSERERKRECERRAGDRKSCQKIIRNLNGKREKQNLLAYFVFSGSFVCICLNNWLNYHGFTFV